MSGFPEVLSLLSMSLIARFKTLEKPVRRRWIWIFLGVLALLFRIPFSIWPGLTEVAYARGLFVGIRYVLDYSIGWLPFPLMYLLLVVVLGLLFLPLIRKWRAKGLARKANTQADGNPSGKTERERFTVKLLRGIHLLGAWIGGIAFLFLIMWGYNYQRVPVEDQMGLTPIPLNADQIESAAIEALVKLKSARDKVTRDTAALSPSDFPEDLPGVMREELSRTLVANGFPAPGRVRVKRIWPGGAMMRLGVAGIYIPFTGQGNIPHDMPIVDQPFTIAHEMSHAMGFGDEGTCNFLAFLACEQSEYPAVVYSGRLNYWSYISRELNRADPERYATVSLGLSPGVKADLEVLRDYSRKYRSFMTLIGYRVNNAYLKTQGVKEGVKSYNRLVVLVEAWKENLGGWL